MNYFDHEYYNPDCSVKKCKYCGGVTFGERVISIDQIPSEIAIHCSTCQTEVAYWAYGNYDPCWANLHPTEGP